MTGQRILLNGKMVELADRPLEAGGRALVYPVPGVDQVVVKVYCDLVGTDLERRLERMMSMAPLGARATHSSQPPELAWPTAIGRGTNGQFLGYAMRRFGEPEHVRLSALFNRRTRLRHFPNRADWRFLLGISWNLAFMTARMHDEKLVAGDFSSNNIVVDRDGFVTFLDCDSIAFTDPATGECFPCRTLTPEYCAPERHQGTPASPAGDDFALAILIYQLLTGGDHPFSGVPRDSSAGDEPSLNDNIISRRSYVVRSEAVKAPAANLDPVVLPPGLLALARAAFGPGAENPAARPKASDWVLAIDEERARIKVCPNRPRHTFGSHLNACPWCRRVALTGQDLFNDVPSMVQMPPMASIPVPKPGSTPVLLTFGITVLVLAVVILIMAKGG